MIITLAGTLTHKGDGFAVVEVAGVGYQVQVNKTTAAALKTGGPVKLWTHEYLREDARELYGFATGAEHRLFRRLLAISGVGPKIAMNLLTLGAVEEIERIIEKGDVARLSSVTGVGKKTAQKIVLELKGKLVSVADEQGDEVVSALVGLGYAREKAREAVRRVGDQETTVEDRLREALRELGR
jgi:Holliday junction DNA helicase RuvA